MNIKRYKFLHEGEAALADRKAKMADKRKLQKQRQK